MEAFRGPPVLSRNLTCDLGKRDRVSWELIERIRQRWEGNLVIKGILSPNDARLACDHGVDAIIVSNHGGRQLDGAVAAFDVLSEVASTVSDAVRILFDSGVRRGTDVLKALAIGARFVFVGRPFLFAASVYGKPGVLHAVHLLAEEIDRETALLRVRTLSELSPALLRFHAGCGRNPMEQTKSYFAI